MKTSNMGGKSTNSPKYLELSLLSWCAVFCHGNGYKYIFISIDLRCVFRWFFALIIFHNHDAPYELALYCIYLSCIWLYTAVYSHIQLKLWTSKSGFLYTDNLVEMILGWNVFGPYKRNPSRYFNPFLSVVTIWKLNLLKSLF